DAGRPAAAEPATPRAERTHHARPATSVRARAGAHTAPRSRHDPPQERDPAEPAQRHARPRRDPRRRPLPQQRPGARVMRSETFQTPGPVRLDLELPAGSIEIETSNTDETHVELEALSDRE